MSQITPLSRAGWNNAVKVDGLDAKSSDDLSAQSRRDAITWLNAVGASYFAALQIPLVAGRDFSNGDTRQTPSVAIVSRTMARKFFATEAVVGRHFQLRQGRSYGPPIEIVGVVGDTKYRSLRDSIRPIVYLAAAQQQPEGPPYAFEIRTSAPPSTVITEVKSAIASINPRVSLDIGTLEQQVNDSMVVMRTIASLSAFFGALALVLAAIGLYGIMAYGVARRRNEIGVRIALGATHSRVTRMVLGEVSRIVAVGVVVGIALSLFATKLVATFLYDTTANDPTTLAEAGAMLLCVGVLAAGIPAMRAARMDPVAALREE